MPYIYRCIAFIIVACLLVLLSLLKYTEVLSKDLNWLSHGPMETSHRVRFFRNHQYMRLANDNDSLVNFVVNSERKEKLPLNNGSSRVPTRFADSGTDFKRTTGLMVMVMASMRTGSTLVGEMFNQNPNLFYLFEPLHATDSLVLRKIVDLVDMETSMGNLLRKLSKCTFPSEFMNDFYTWRIARVKSQTLRSLCESKTDCKTLAPTQLSRLCYQKHGNMAMKFIRASLDMFEPLVTDNDLNVKILHLVRDPRGTANSRKFYYCPRRSIPPKQCTLNKLNLLNSEYSSYKYQVIPKYCNWLRKNLQTALSRPEWLKDRYKLIRYEDLASEPLRFTKDIYEFLNLPLPKVVLDWVTENTQQNTEESNQTFSTRKNSTEASTNWRNTLSFQESQDVERVCSDVMETLGYRPIRTEEDLSNYTVPVFEPLDIGADISMT